MTRPISEKTRLIPINAPMPTNWPRMISRGLNFLSPKKSISRKMSSMLEETKARMPVAKTSIKKINAKVAIEMETDSTHVLIAAFNNSGNHFKSLFGHDRVAAVRRYDNGLARSEHKRFS